MNKRSFKPRKGKQFDPAELPVFQGLGGKYYDPNYSRKDKLLLAQRGSGDVPHLARGDEDLNFMTVGQGNNPPEGWWDATHHRGVELPDWAASMSPEWARQHGYVIDPHGYDPRSWFLDPHGRWNYAGDASSGGGRNALEFRWPGGSKGLEGRKGQITSLAQWRAAHPDGSGLDMTPASVRGDTGSRTDRDLSTPMSWGLGTQFFETPESFFPRATPAPSNPATGQGQVMAGGKNIGYDPGTYTGEIGAPGDPEHAGEDFGGGTSFDQYGRQTFEGTTAGPGGDKLAYQTNSYYDPQYGWVPHAQLANSLASNNPLDYFNPFGHTSEGGPGTGGPTQRWVGRGVGTASNLIFPGSGFLTGPAARYITSLFQGKNPTPQQVQQAVQQAQKEGKLPPMPSGSVPLPVHSTGSGYQPSSLDPYGNAVTGREWWSDDFGRGTGGANAPGGYNLAGSGGAFGTRGIGFNTGGGGTVGRFATAIGFGGQGFGSGGISANAQALGGGALARHYMNMLQRTGYVAPTQALVGGAQPGVLQGTQAGGYMGNIVNPAAFGQMGSAQNSIHMRQKATD